MKELLKLTAAIGVCQAGGAAGALFTTPASAAWYAQLAKPALTPPDWIFAPVWIFVYTLMGVSLYLVWEKRTHEQCHCMALGIFFFQLFLNALWSVLFFAAKEPLLALFGIVVLLFAILAIIWQFWGISKWASYLLMPYGAWVVFAAYLNFAIWQLNS